jgi:hypothetical protein
MTRTVSNGVFRARQSGSIGDHHRLKESTTADSGDLSVVER